MNVYDSVMAAWLPAMTVLDKLIDGMPYSIENSAILLALSAWHLFPNMSVLSNTSQFVKQDDPLLDARGILTLGLQSVTSAYQRQSPDDITRGITWSLPLAHYKYYGGPVETEKSLNTDGSRLSMAQFVQLALGSYFSGWKEHKFGAVDAALLIQDIWNCVTKKNEARFRNQHIPSNNSWLAIMANGAKEFSKSENSVRTEYTKLFNYGKRRCPQLIGLNDRTPSPIATLRRPEVLLGFPKTAEGRIYLLRQVAQRLGCEPKAMLIRYAMAKPEGRKPHFGLASVVPMQSSKGGGSTNVRWEPDTAFKEYSLGTLRGSIESLKESDIMGPMTTGRQFIWNNAPSHYSKQKLVDMNIDDFFGMFAELVLFGKSAGDKEPRRAKGVPFELLFGDPHTAAIYTLASKEKSAIDVFGAQDVRLAVTDETAYRLQSSMINHLADVVSNEGSALTLSGHVKSLKTLSTIHKIYNDLPGAKIAMRATSRALHEAKWVPDTDLHLLKLQKERERRKLPNERMETPEELKVQLFQAYEPGDLDLATTFACIAFFESGNINLSNDGLDNVMAMSSGDSLFIANALLSDPATVVRSNVRRIRGNVGKAGIALLVPPQQVMTRKPQAQDWNVLDYDTFDGVITDSFKATTLHMSFTDFILPVDVGTRIRNVEVYFLETVISVHDKGEWIGDLDIIPIATNPLLRMLPSGTTCKQHKANNINIEDLELINVDSWKEFFDRPEEPIVFRAKGNWMARLAASSISVTQGHLTLMFGEHVCWGCGMEERDRLRHKAHPIFLL